MGLQLDQWIAKVLMITEMGLPQVALTRPPAEGSARMASVPVQSVQWIVKVLVITEMGFPWLTELVHTWKTNKVLLLPKNVRRLLFLHPPPTVLIPLVWLPTPVALLVWRARLRAALGPLALRAPPPPLLAQVPRAVASWPSRLPVRSGPFSLTSTPW